MIKIKPNDLIAIVPDLINLFLSGFIFLITYNWLNSKKTDTSILTIGSIFISVLIQSLCSFFHEFVLSNVLFSDAEKILIYFILGFVLAVIISIIGKMRFVSYILFKIGNKTINSDIFDDVIDYKKKTMMMVYLKSSDIYYIGQLLYNEEKGIDSWICLIDYISVNKETNEKIFDSNESGKKSTALVNLKDVERIQLIYEDDTELWNKFRYK